ncbi:MAG: ribosome maturation factor RimP [Treponema sp.]|nr:ribosome maturation factor RimP [Treponema sp.]
MEYTSYKDIKYYKECAPLVEGLGFKLVDLKIIPAKTITKISAIIASPDPAANIGVNDCAKVHRVLLPRLEALLGTEDTTMELTSPGIEHNIKNAAEFSVFIGRAVRVWDKIASDWVNGTILKADDKSVELKKEEGDSVTILFENIAKAKFMYKKEEA